MTSDYQSGALAMREMAHEVAALEMRNAMEALRTDLTEQAAREGRAWRNLARSIATKIEAIPLPADPASSEGADEVAKPPLGDPEYARQWALDTLSGRAGGGKFEWGQRNLARAFLNCDADPAAARGNLVLLAECNLLLLEETCRYSLGLAEDLIGDALTKAVGDKVIAMRDEAATLRAALTEQIELTRSAKQDYDNLFSETQEEVGRLQGELEKARTALTKISQHRWAYVTVITIATEALAALKAPTP